MFDGNRSPEDTYEYFDGRRRLVALVERSERDEWCEACGGEAHAKQSFDAGVNAGAAIVFGLIALGEWARRG